MTPYRAMKRIMDIAGAVFGLVVFSPLMIWAAFKIARENSGKIIFRQERAGLNGRPFTLYKFRSMTDARDERGEPRSDAERLTPFGKRLRSTSLDELPQLLNVLLGDMSLVGPRPLLLEYVPLYSETERTRLSVRPGITGWAQINGRNSISWPEKFALDVWYVKNASLSLDIKILFLTVKKALAREGISADGDATMPRFTGER
jgi:lipopolysaccharide/colanic/teichoic acid biosynthesis glycosyltransferase